MNCVICKNGRTRRAGITVSLDRGETTVVVRSVPAEVCENCGEEYLDEATTSQILRTADAAAQAGVKIEVRDYLAA
ncbi:MAG: type II toxin-antitoxin system MqsA family antitoxin [Deltaproteobacteria bacterium]|nr:type II toxin-antitoxin system MqsA family antitoxin [Deltaproteobacteria bacterium]